MLQDYCLHLVSSLLFYVMDVTVQLPSGTPKQSQTVELYSEGAPGPWGYFVLLFGVALLLQPTK